jgi:hypothetical protein
MAKTGNPFKGNPLNRLSLFNARPINRDALRVVEPSDQRKKKKAPPTKAGAHRVIEREDRRQKLIKSRRQLVKKDGSTKVIPAGKL